MGTALLHPSIAVPRSQPCAHDVLLAVEKSSELVKLLQQQNKQLTGALGKSEKANAKLTARCEAVEGSVAAKQSARFRALRARLFELCRCYREGFGV